MKVRSKTGSWCATTSWCSTLSRKSAAKTSRGFGPSEMKQIERLGVHLEGQRVFRVPLFAAARPVVPPERPCAPAAPKAA